MYKKQRHFAGLKRKQQKFCEKNRRFIVIEFVKTCDELVIGQGLLSGSWRLWWVQVDGGLGFSWTPGSNIKQGLDTRYVIYYATYTGYCDFTGSTIHTLGQYKK